MNKETHSKKKKLAQTCEIQSKYEVIIIGAGPGGLAAAKVLSEAGRRVLVLEKNDERGEKICAGGITSRDFYLGLPKELISKEFQSVLLHSQNNKFQYNGNDVLLHTISREDLSWYQQSDDLHPDLSMSTSKKVIQVEKDHVVIEGDQKILYDVLIGADGSDSMVRKYLEVPTTKKLLAMQYLVPKSLDDFELFFNVERFGVSYLWIIPHKEYTSIGLCVDVSKNPDTTKQKKELEAFITEKGFQPETSVYQEEIVNYDYRGFAFGNIFLVGDAGGFASGLTGEGIYSAILSGKEVAEYILDRDYGFPLLEAWLEKKAKQEKVLRYCEKMESVADKCLDTGLSLLKYPFVQKFLFNLTGL